MADVYSAGTMMTAVMQTAGFAAQAEILNSLELFLRKFGVLIFILSAGAGLFSILLASQYRVGLALIFGPVIFTFLIFSRSPISGAVWRIGPGAPRAADGTTASQQDALSSVSEVVTGSNTLEVQQVSSLFKLVTHVIDSVTKSLTNALLPLKDDGREDVKNLLFIAKTHALDQLLNLRLDNSLALDILHRDMITQCNDLLDAGLERTSPNLREYELKFHQDALARETNQDLRLAHERTIERMTKRRLDAEAKFNLAAQKRINPSHSTWKFMEASQSLPSSDSATTRWMSKRHPGKRVEEIRSSSMTCGELWEIAADAVFEAARGQVGEVLSTHGGMLDSSQRGEFCVELANKIGLKLGPLDAPTCERYGLVQVASILLIRNTVKSTGYSKAIQRTKDEMQFYGSAGKGRAIPLDLDKSDHLELVTDPFNTSPTVITEDGVSKTVGRFRNKHTGEVESFDRPYVMMTFDVAGELDSGFVFNQQALTRELRQYIFTFAMQFPYYMGVLLYFLAIAFPFVAVVSIFPGRAGLMLNYFLAWLWIKSWDVGFALVVVLDRFIWNVFPATDFSEPFWGGRNLSTVSLPDVLKKGFDIDPAFNTHAYYFALSLALSFIPTVTGYMTIKLRRGVVDGLVDPFIGGLQGVARERASVASNVFYERAITENNQHMKETFGAAGLTEGQQGIGLLAGAKFDSAQYWADQLTNARTEAPLLLHKESQTLSKKAQIMEELQPNIAKRALYETIRPELALAASKQRIMHSELSASGRFGIMANNIAAAMDGSGTYELTRYPEALGEAISALKSAVISKERWGIEISSVEEMKQRGVDNDVRRTFHQTNAGDFYAPLDLTRKYSGSSIESMMQWAEMLRYGADHNRLADYYESLGDEAGQIAAREKEERLARLRSFLQTNDKRTAAVTFSSPIDESLWNLTTPEPLEPNSPTGREGVIR